MSWIRYVMGHEFSRSPSAADELLFAVAPDLGGIRYWSADVCKHRGDLSSMCVRRQRAECAYRGRLSGSALRRAPYPDGPAEDRPCRTEASANGAARRHVLHKGALQRGASPCLPPSSARWPTVQRTSKTANCVGNFALYPLLGHASPAGNFGIAQIL